MSTFYIIPSNDDIQHHGVLGMKWGVRRYENKGGSYTQKGINNFNNSLSKYESAKKKLKDEKQAKNVTVETKQEYKNTKRQLKEDYKQIKKDYRADKGKDLYQSGKTVTDINSSFGNKAGTVLISAGIAATTAALYKMGDQKVYINDKAISAKKLVGAMGITSMAVGGLINIKNHQDVKYLRAYYGHSRNSKK